jgi:uncharacterized protein (DUF1810 family)
MLTKIMNGLRLNRSQTYERENKLARFLDLQRGMMREILTSLRNGRLDSRWIAFVFPTGKSDLQCKEQVVISLVDVEEAKDYLSNKKLHDRLMLCCDCLLCLDKSRQDALRHDPSSQHIMQSMKLFLRAEQDNKKFSDILHLLA